MRLEDIFPPEYFIPTEQSIALAKEPMYVFDDVNQMVATHSGWDYYNKNWNGHRVPRFDGKKWFVFSNTEAAEKFVTNTLKRDLEDFSFQYVNQDRVAEICKK